MGRFKYTKEVLEPVVKSSVSYAEVIRRLGLKQQGSRQSLIRDKCKRFGIDTSHFLGRSANQGDAHKGGPDKISWRKILVWRKKHYREKAYRLRRALIEMGRPYVCSEPSCKVKGTWLKKSLVLQVDHINGDWSDCRPKNLRFLCPNCHSQKLHGGNKGYTDVVSASRQSREYRRKNSGRVVELADTPLRGGGG